MGCDCVWRWSTARASCAELNVCITKEEFASFGRHGSVTTQHPLLYARYGKKPREKATLSPGWQR